MSQATFGKQCAVKRVRIDSRIGPLFAEVYRTFLPAEGAQYFVELLDVLVWFHTPGLSKPTGMRRKVEHTPKWWPAALRDYGVPCEHIQLGKRTSLTGAAARAGTCGRVLPSAGCSWAAFFVLVSRWGLSPTADGRFSEVFGVQ